MVFPKRIEPGLCNRREHRDERGRDLFDEKREGVAVPTAERFEEEKVRSPSSNAASYRKFRVQRPASASLWFRSYLHTYLERDVRAVSDIRDFFENDYRFLSQF